MKKRAFVLAVLALSGSAFAATAPKVTSITVEQHCMGLDVRLNGVTPWPSRPLPLTDFSWHDEVSGFHFTVPTNDGAKYNLEFEYAGWSSEGEPVHGYLTCNGISANSHGELAGNAAFCSCNF